MTVKDTNNWRFDDPAMKYMDNVGDHTAAFVYGNFSAANVWNPIAFREHTASKLIDKDLAELGLKPIPFKDFGDPTFKMCMMFDGYTEDKFMKEYLTSLALVHFISGEAYTMAKLMFG